LSFLKARNLTQCGCAIHLPTVYKFLFPFFSDWGCRCWVDGLYLFFFPQLFSLFFIFNVEPAVNALKKVCSTFFSEPPSYTTPFLTLSWRQRGGLSTTNQSTPWSFWARVARLPPIFPLMSPFGSFHRLPGFQPFASAGGGPGCDLMCALWRSF